MAEEEDEEDNNEKLAAARLRVDEEDRDMRSEIQRQDRRRNQENFFEGGDADVAGVVKSLHDRYQRTTLSHSNSLPPPQRDYYRKQDSPLRY